MAERNPYHDAAYLMSQTQEGAKVIEHLMERATKSTLLVKDKNGRSDPLAMAHAAGWLDCVRYLERMVNNGKLARQSG